MNPSQRQLVGIASRIRDQLIKLKQIKRLQVQSKATGLIEQMNRLTRIRRKLQLCDVRKWQSAATKVLGQAEAALRDIPFHLQQVGQSVQACNITTPSVADIYRELMQADEEFDGLTYHPEGDLLAVTTDPIELQDVYLGEFEIQLHVPSLAEMRYNSIFRIVALDPHPAASNDCVTHPHISDERLCSGDAGASINIALVTGRICDFFLLVRSVLTTYNPDSPYVSLSNWTGVPCYDCGWVMDDENEYFCQFCENVFCGECSDYCRRCHDGACRGCLTECPVCQDLTCPGCMSVCPECGEPLCKTCLDDMACPCIEENEETEHEETKEQPQTVATSEATQDREHFDVVREAARATESTVGIDAA